MYPLILLLVPFHAVFFGNKNIYQTNKILDYMPESMVINWKTFFNFNLGWTEKDFEIAQNSWPKVQRLIRILHKQGIMLTAGTDANNPWIVPGDSFHTELELLRSSVYLMNMWWKLQPLMVRNLWILQTESENWSWIWGWSCAFKWEPSDDITNMRKIELILLDGKIVKQEVMLPSLNKF